MQLSKVFWGLKVNWKNFSTKMRKYFPIYFTSTESCALSKVNWNQQKSIGINESQLELIYKSIGINKKCGKIFLRNLSHDQSPKIK